MKIKKGDTVRIMAGKDRGKSAGVLKVFPESDRVLLEGLNVFSKKVKPKKSGQKGEVVTVSRPLPASRVMLVCPSCKKPTRIGARIESNTKVRICKKCQAVL